MPAGECLGASRRHCASRRPCEGRGPSRRSCMERGVLWARSGGGEAPRRPAPRITDWRDRPLPSQGRRLYLACSQRGQLRIRQPRALLLGALLALHSIPPASSTVTSPLRRQGPIASLVHGARRVMGALGWGGAPRRPAPRITDWRDRPLPSQGRRLSLACSQRGQLRIRQPLALLLATPIALHNIPPASSTMTSPLRRQGPIASLVHGARRVMGVLGWGGAPR
jgi:hypothetical protein